MPSCFGAADPDSADLDLTHRDDHLAVPLNQRLCEGFGVGGGSPARSPGHTTPGPAWPSDASCMPDQTAAARCSAIPGGAGQQAGVDLSRYWRGASRWQQPAAAASVPRRSVTATATASRWPPPVIHQKPARPAPHNASPDDGVRSRTTRASAPRAAFKGGNERRPRRRHGAPWRGRRVCAANGTPAAARMDGLIVSPPPWTCVPARGERTPAPSPVASETGNRRAAVVPDVVGPRRVP